ncbi:hypothetical protein CR513_53661, partial [Mucuna pruriens]
MNLHFEFPNFDDFTNYDCTCIGLTECPICLEISNAINEGVGITNIIGVVEVIAVQPLLPTIVQPLQPLINTANKVQADVGVMSQRFASGTLIVWLVQVTSKLDSLGGSGKLRKILQVLSIRLNTVRLSLFDKKEAQIMTPLRRNKKEGSSLISRRQHLRSGERTPLTSARRNDVESKA